MTNDIEEQYADMVKEGERADMVLKNNNYHVPDTKRCGNCKHFYTLSIEDPTCCALAMSETWINGEVEECGVCDKHEVRQ